MKATMQLIEAALRMACALKDLDPDIYSDQVWKPKHMRVYRGFRSAVRKYLATRKKQ